MLEPPLFDGATNATVTEPLPAVTVPMVGASEGVLYTNADGSDSDPLLEAVSVTGPVAVGVMLKV